MAGNTQGPRRPRRDPASRSSERHRMARARRNRASRVEPEPRGRRRQRNLGRASSSSTAAARSPRTSPSSRRKNPTWNANFAARAIKALGIQGLPSTSRRTRSASGSSGRPTCRARRTRRTTTCAPLARLQSAAPGHRHQRPGQTSTLALSLSQVSRRKLRSRSRRSRPASTSASRPEPAGPRRARQDLGRQEHRGSRARSVDAPAAAASLTNSEHAAGRADQADGCNRSAQG
jgi:hypothetical protein